MTERSTQRPRSPREMRQRLIGPALDRDAEDRAFWRHADERVRGETLYELLALGERLYASIPHPRQEMRRLLLRREGLLRVERT